MLQEEKVWEVFQMIGKKEMKNAELPDSKRDSRFRSRTKKNMRPQKKKYRMQKLIVIQRLPVGRKPLENLRKKK